MSAAAPLAYDWNRLDSELILTLMEAVRDSDELPSADMLREEEECWAEAERPQLGQPVPRAQQRPLRRLAPFVDTSAALWQGERVEVHGLVGAAQHNGKRANVLEYNAERGRYTVAITGSGGGAVIAVKPANLAARGGDGGALRVARALTVCSRVCRDWRAAARADALWKPLCQARWWAKQGFIPTELNASACLPVGELSAKELKLVLKRRSVDMSGLFEKQQYRDAAAATNFADGTLPWLQQTERELLPSWLPLAGKWKASFAFAESDVRRRGSLTRLELTGREWTMRFRGGGQLPDGREYVLSRFRKDLRYSSTMDAYMEANHPGMGAMTWQFCDDRTDGPRRPAVQVASYPPLVIERLDDFSWTLTNQHVVFTSCAPDTMREDELHDFSRDDTK